MTKIIDFDGLYVAYLDQLTGQGQLVCPDPAGDLAMDEAPLQAVTPSDGSVGYVPPCSLHEACEQRALSELDALGWEPSEGEDGWPSFCVDGYTADGRQVVGLYGRDPIITDPALDQLAEASAELSRLSGIVSPPT